MMVRFEPSAQGNGESADVNSEGEPAVTPH